MKDVKRSRPRTQLRPLRPPLCFGHGALVGRDVLNNVLLNRIAERRQAKPSKYINAVNTLIIVVELWKGFCDDAALLASFLSFYHTSRNLPLLAVRFSRRLASSCA